MNLRQTLIPHLQKCLISIGVDQGVCTVQTWRNTHNTGERSGAKIITYLTLSREENEKKLYISTLAKLNVKPTLWWFTNLFGGKEKAGGGLCVGMDFSFWRA